MGVIYGQDCPIAPVRGLGSGMPRTTLVVGQDEWTAGSGRYELEPGKPKESGIELAVSRNKYGEGKRIRERWFFTWAALGRIESQIAGVKLQ